VAQTPLRYASRGGETALQNGGHGSSQPRSQHYAIKKNAEALLVASKENGLEVNADKNKYILMSLDQVIGGSHNLNFDNRSLERLEEVRYLGTIVMNQNSIEEQIKSTFS
jgi:hypothetical protein